MADYSDSEEDEIAYSTTSVLLGYAEEELSSATDDSISHLGGLPTWFHESSPADSRLAKCLCCNQVMPLLLQLDGNIPESPSHQRMLYVFGCRSKTCRRKPGSIRSVRGVKVLGTRQETSDTTGEVRIIDRSVVEEPQPTKSNLGDMIFGAKSDVSASVNPFASTSGITNPFASASSNENPFASPHGAANPFAPKLAPAADPAVASLTKSFAAVTAIHTPKPTPTLSRPDPALIGPPSPWPAASSIPSYPSFFLDAHYEELEPQADLISRQAAELAKTMKIEDDDMDVDEPANSKKRVGKGKDKDEAFESSINKTFDHFQTIANQNPEQVLRYERGGVPLLYSRNDATGNIISPMAQSGKVVTTGTAISTAKVPKCKICGGSRVFELQLMPFMISVLEEAGDVDVMLEGMEWGTIIVATCKQDCMITGGGGGGVSGGGYAEEWVGVQWEEEMKLK